MPRSKTKIENNTFVKGLITEAGPLTFPDNASLVDENFVLNVDGSRQRRLGVNYEVNNIKKTITSLENTTTTTKSFTWKSVNNDGDLDIAVIQVGNLLYFYDNNVTPVTGSPLNGGNSVTVGTILSTKFEFTESYGKLIIATGEEDVTVLTYDSILDLISPITYRLEIRDIFGVEEIPPLRVDERPLGGLFFPTPISDTHNYNLRNQGWPLLAEVATDSTGTLSVFTDPLGQTASNPKTDYRFPSNSDIFSLGKIGSASSIKVVNAYSPWELVKSNLTTSQAPRGHYIIDLFNRGASRNAKPSMANLVNDETDGGITAVASYAGRVFYSIKSNSINANDKNSPNLGSMILFSNSTDSVEDLGKCYAKNDPSAEDFNDPLDTDGGFITIPEIGQVYKLVTLGESLFVIASKGVWEISGGEGYFSATNQSITKTANFGAISGSSVVVGETLISFWSPGGIYSISIGEVSASGQVSNLTQNTIQSFYNDIDFVAKGDVVGTYDDVSKQVRWLYREGVLANNNYYNRELIFDLNLKAFYVNNLQELAMTTGSSPYVIGYLDLSSIVFTDLTEQVIVGAGNNVQVLTVDVTTSVRQSDQNTEGSTKYWAIRDLGTGSAQLTVAGYLDLNFEDWSDETDSSGNSGKDALSQVLTGYTTDGDSEVEKKSKYITVFCKRTESGFTDDGLGNLTPIGASSCLIQGQWEWTDSPAAGRWTNEQEAYRLPRAYVPTGVNDPFDYSFTVVKTKNKLRGKGSALSLLFKSAPGKDLHLYGWAREVTLPQD